MSKQLRLVIDLDGTLCSQERSDEYHLAKPKVDIINKVNRLVDQGWHVTIFTARGMESCGGDWRKIHQKYKAPTILWLKNNDVRYHVLKFGKPSADIYVDDKSMPVEFFMD